MIVNKVIQVMLLTAFVVSLNSCVSAVANKKEQKEFVKSSPSKPNIIYILAVKKNKNYV